MQWEKLVEREGDFLKNHLLYENFETNFPKIFQTHHANFLTVREGNTFIHYLDKNHKTTISRFIKNQLEKDPDFMKKNVEIGKKHFKNLITFCEELGDLQNKNNEELGKLAQEYFRLYKEPYPHFNLTVFSDELEKEGNTEIINLMADWRLFARDHFNRTHKLADSLFEEIAKRLSLSAEEVKFLKPQEIVDYLSIKSRIRNRHNCYFMFNEGKFELKENESYVVKESFSNEVKGRGTFSARYSGRVRAIKKNEDLKEVEEGEVIVLRMTTPDLMLEGIKKAGAIITDEGGITCHAAVLSREFKIPALMGTTNATRIFKTGDYVSVDTELGSAYRVQPPNKS